MPYSIHPEPDDAFVCVSLERCVTAADLDAALTEVCERWSGKALDVLLDWRGTNALLLIPEEMPGLIAALTHYDACIPGGCSAWLTRDHQDNPVSIGALLDRRVPQGVRARRFFTDEEEAKAWLRAHRGLDGVYANRLQPTP